MKIPILRRLVIDAAIMGYALATFIFELGRRGSLALAATIIAAVAFVGSVDYVRGHLKKIAAVIEAEARR